VRLAAGMSVHQERVRVAAVSLAATLPLAAALQVRGVPVIFINDRRHNGPLAEPIFVQQVLLAGK
jgi:protein-disulfide isomerase